MEYPRLSLSTLFPWEKVHHWTRILTFRLDWLTSHLHCPQYFLKCLTLGLLLSWWLYTLVLGFHLLWWLYTVFHWILYRPPKVSSGHTGFLVFVKVFTKKKKSNDSSLGRHSPTNSTKLLPFIHSENVHKASSRDFWTEIQNPLIQNLSTAIQVTYSSLGNEQKANFQIGKTGMTFKQLMNDLWITLIVHPCFLALLLLAWCLCYFSVSCVCCMACLQHWITDNFLASTFHFTTWTHTTSG